MSSFCREYSDDDDGSDEHSNNGKASGSCTTQFSPYHILRPGVGPPSYIDTCPGIPLEWPLPHVYSTYPFQRHEDPTCDPGYSIAKHPGSDFWIKSHQCRRLSLPDGSACLECQTVRRKRDQLADLAQHILPHTSNKLRTHEQLVTRNQEMWESGQSWKLKVCSHIFAVCIGDRIDI